MGGIEKSFFIKILRDRYRRANKKDKGEILDEVQGQLSVTRKHAIRLLSPKEPGRPRNPLKRGRPSKYQDYEFICALKEVWRITNFMCSRLLKEAIPDWLPHIEQARGPFPESVRIRLLSISPPTMDRILKRYKATKGKSFTRSAGFRDQIPIQENIWDIQLPGFMESDTVAHCGGSMHGEFINTLTMVDIATIWTEARGVFGRGSNAVFDKLKDIEATLPFPIKGYDADNGGEVLNQHILRYFHDERIEQGREVVQVTRSREYQKNDNAHVEQRNDSIARRYLGYERLDFRELLSLVNCYYSQIVCPLHNHFYPTFKLKDKIRIKSRTRRVYAKPITPYSRLMNSPHLADALKQELQDWHQQLNPVTLVRLERIVRKQIDISMKQLRAGIKPSKKSLAPPSLPPRPIFHMPTNNVPLYQVSGHLNHTRADMAHNISVT